MWQCVCVWRFRYWLCCVHIIISPFHLTVLILNALACANVFVCDVCLRIWREGETNVSSGTSLSSMVVMSFGSMASQSVHSCRKSASLAAA